MSVTTAVLVFLLVGGGASFAARWVAQHQSLTESVRRTSRMAQVLEPKLQAYLAGTDPSAESDLFAEVKVRVGTDGLTELVVWDGDGTVLFSDDPSEIGARGPVSDDISRTLRTGEPSAGFDDAAPEADKVSGRTPAQALEEAVKAGGAAPATKRAPERYVEVYVRQAITGRDDVVVEAYYDYERVESLTHSLFLLLLPLVLVPLLLVLAIQLPIALSLARRVRRHEEERTSLLEEALSVSDRERVRFAADLHDGPIQELAGIGYALGVISPGVPDKHRSLMGRVEAALQRAILGLRGVMTDLYPPDLRTGSLDQAVETLAGPLREEGVNVVVTLESLPRMSDETVGTFYRVTREALANVAKHAGATRVGVTLERIPGGRGIDRVRLTIADDGVGLDPDNTDRRAEGHLGLRLISDRVATLGGRLSLESGSPHGGTVVTAELPLTLACPAIPPDGAAPVG